MNRTERAQIRLLFEHWGSEYRAKAAARQRAMHADHASRRVLQSGGTIKAALRIAEELAGDYVRELTAAVSDVAKDTEAFGMIVTDVTIFFRDLQDGVDQAVKFATIGGEEFLSASSDANRRFLEIKQATLRLLELQRFAFTRPSPGDKMALAPIAEAKSKAEAPRKNHGGRPLATHWDEMWAAIAVSAEKDNIGRKAEEMSGGRLLFLMAVKRDSDGRNVTEQIIHKIGMGG